MVDYIQEAFLRIFAMQKEAVATLKTDIDTQFWPWQGDPPYFTSRFGPSNEDLSSYSEDIGADVDTVLMRIVTAHITEDYRGNAQDKTHQYIALIKSYFRQHPMLTTDAGTYADDGGPDFLLWGGGNQVAEIKSHTGTVVFTNSGIGAMQLGCEFTLTLPYLSEVL